MATEENVDYTVDGSDNSNDASDIIYDELMDSFKGTKAEIQGGSLYDWLQKQFKDSLLAFRTIFGMFMVTMITKVTIKLQWLELFPNIYEGITFLVLLICYIGSFYVEEIKERQKLRIQNTKNIIQERREFIRLFRKWAFDQWLPSAKDNNERIRMLEAIQNFVGIMSTVEVKKDVANLGLMLQEMTQIFMENMRDIPKNIREELRMMLPQDIINKGEKERPKKVDDLTPNDPIFPKNENRDEEET